MTTKGLKYCVVVIEHGHHQRTEHDWELGWFATLREARARAAKFNRGNDKDPDHGMFGEAAIVEDVPAAPTDMDDDEARL